MKNKLVYLAIMLPCVVLLGFGCGESDDDQDACGNFNSVCAGVGDFIDCEEVMDKIEDCQKKCMSKGENCDDIMMCITDASGDLYDRYCNAEEEEGNQDGDKKQGNYPSSLPKNDCISSNCSSAYNDCNVYKDCVDLAYCLKDCRACEDNCDEECEDDCANRYGLALSYYQYFSSCDLNNECGALY